MSSRKNGRQRLKALKVSISNKCSRVKAPMGLKLSIYDRASSSQYRSDEQASRRLGFCDKSVPEGTHICLFYENPAERDDVMFEFLRAGIADKERCWCVLYDQQPLNWIKQSYDRGIDLEPALDCEQVTIADTGRFYLPEDGFCADSTVARLHGVTNSAIQQGYCTFRGFGEVSWVAERKHDQHRVVEYEQKLNRNYFHNSPSVIVCIYDIKDLDDAFLNDILAAHPYYIYKGTFKTNPCYSIQ